jgi:hypothetical protein
VNTTRKLTVAKDICAFVVTMSRDYSDDAARKICLCAARLVTKQQAKLDDATSNALFSVLTRALDSGCEDDALRALGALVYANAPVIQKVRCGMRSWG